MHVSKDEDDFKRAIQNMEVRKIETIFETVQAQISNLKNRDQEIHGLEEQVVAGSKDCCAIRIQSVGIQ